MVSEILTPPKRTINKEHVGLPIPRMDWDNTNLLETWRKFQSTVELMFQGPLQPKDEAIKVSYLLLWVGERGREIADTWTDISEEDKKKLAPHYERFRKHVQPKLNPIFSRYKFNLATQGTDTIEQYLTKLETLAKDCNFNDPDEMIRDRIVFGVSEERARKTDQGRIRLNTGQSCSDRPNV